MIRNLELRDIQTEFSRIEEDLATARRSLAAGSGGIADDVAANTKAIALNTAKETNATHTGDVTGDEALTIASGAVDIAHMSATGTPDNTTYLRGDNTWATPGGGGGGDTVAANNETITGLWNMIADGGGGLTDYDVEVGDSADYGIIRMGDAIMGRTSYNSGSLDLDGAIILRNVGAPATSNIEFAFAESSNAIRFAIPKSGVGNATYNPRSMLIAGPAVLNDAVVTVGYWQTQGIFDNLDCDTGSDGADLGVQNDLEVEGDIFADSILESTTGAGVTIDGVLIKDGEVDGIDVATDVAANTAARHTESHTVVSHSDTTATGTELNELTDGSETSLHSHPEKEYASFYLTTGGRTGLSGSEIILVLDNTRINSDVAVFSLASNQVTVDKTGDFKISIDVYINLSGSSRSEYSCYLKQNGTEVTGTRFVAYARGYDSGQTTSFSDIISVTTGDYFEIACIRTDGAASTGYQDANGTRFVIEEK